MDRQQMTRREWVSAQLTTWQNVLSAIWIFAILMYTFIHGFNLILQEVSRLFRR